MKIVAELTGASAAVPRGSHEVRITSCPRRRLDIRFPKFATHILLALS